MSYKYTYSGNGGCRPRVPTTTCTTTTYRPKPLETTEKTLSKITAKEFQEASSVLFPLFKPKAAGNNATSKNKENKFAKIIAAMAVIFFACMEILGIVCLTISFSKRDTDGGAWAVITMASAAYGLGINIPKTKKENTRFKMIVMKSYGCILTFKDKEYDMPSEYSLLVELYRYDPDIALSVACLYQLFSDNFSFEEDIIKPLCKNTLIRSRVKQRLIADGDLSYLSKTYNVLSNPKYIETFKNDDSVSRKAYGIYHSILKTIAETQGLLEKQKKVETQSEINTLMSDDFDQIEPINAKKVDK